MRVLFSLALIGSLTGCATNPRTIHVYYGADSPFHVGSLTMRQPIAIATTLACEDGYVTSLNAFNRMGEELRRTPSGSRSYNQELLFARANKYRRDFPSPSNSTTINIPKCVILWPSGYSHEFPSFSIDLSKATFPYEVTNSFDRVLSQNDARDVQDQNAATAQLKKERQELKDAGGSYSSTPMQQPAPVIQTVPVFRPQPLPTMPTVPFPSAPGRTTTICRTLSNGTVVCD